METVGFFDDDELDGVEAQETLGSDACSKCGLSKGCVTPMMGFAGEGGKGILIVAESPSAADDISGAPLEGETGQWFAGKLKRLGININRDCWKTNAVACHAAKAKNNTPTKSQVKYCSTRLRKTIDELKPQFIWLMGTDAIYSYYHDRIDNISVNRFAGLCIPDMKRKAWVLPMYHPSFAFNKEKDAHFQMFYDKQLEHAIKCSKSYVEPEAMPIDNVRILKKFEDVVAVLYKVLEVRPEKFAFDYETTGLKPYRDDHKIASVGFCYEYDLAYSFPYQYRDHFTQKERTIIADLWHKIMSDPDIKKIAANSKFEDMWTREFFNVSPENMYWCTMNAAHILDNRKSFSGLKFQSLIRWDIPEYDKSIAKYLKSDKDTPFNRIMEAPLNELLLYDGIDSLLTFNLYEEQEEEFRKYPKMRAAREFFMEGLYSFCDLQENGIPLNRQYYLDQDVELIKQIEEMETSLHEFPEAQRFLRERGRPINFGSPQDKADLFFNIMGLKSIKPTGGGGQSVDASVMEELDTPLAKEITAISKLKKIHGTYLGQFNREIDDDDKLHPFFDLHTTSTFRGSSSRVNFQNIPVREQKAMTITRGGVIPSLGNMLTDFDFGSMEVRIIACYTQDENLMAYINDPSTDMHRDQAKELFSFTDKQWDFMVSLDKQNHTKHAKDVRFVAKNDEVFALFYGSYYGSIARGVFPKLKKMTTGYCNMFEHLRDVGIIRSLATAEEDFERHVKHVEKKFWNRFKGVKAWQEKMFKSYLEKGYIEQLFGFRTGGYLSKNDICNYNIQGTAFHCLVWVINKLIKAMEEREMNSKIIGQIHDCCLGDLVPEEKHDWCHLSNQIATIDIRKEHPWIIVPLDIEFEGTEVNQPWSTKEEFLLESLTKH